LVTLTVALLMASVSISRGQVSQPQDGEITAPGAAAGPVLPSLPNYRPGEVIVKLKESRAGGIQASSQAAALQKVQASLLRLRDKYGVEDRGAVFKRTREGLRYHVLKTQRSVLAVCAELNVDPDVGYAQPNYIYHICRTPNDPKFPDQYAHQLIQMEDAWDISTGSRDVVVAVLDTGVDVNHPDLKDNIWVNPNEIPGNGIDDDGNGYVDDVHGWNFESDNNHLIPTVTYDETVGHGTWVSGVIAGVGNNDKGVCGVNWQCSIMALRMSLYVTSAEVAEGLDYAAANGADILNMSFGADEFGPGGDLIVHEAIDNAFDQGVLLVSSAGNSNTDRVSYPAAYYNVMAVSATDAEDVKTEYSMFGPWVDIAAPGTDIVTTALGGEYLYTAGTSFSSPYVAAVAALVLAHRPELTNVELRAILENTTDPVYYGQVDPDYCYIGTGRVNAFTALENADVRFPLGEIVAPGQAEVFARDTNSVDVVLFVHGDSYRLEYSPYANKSWTLISEGAGPTDPNGLVQVPFAVPAAGVYDLRLSVTSDGYTHTDRKVFSVGTAVAQEHWPKPESLDDISSIETFYGNAICMDVDGDGRNEIIQASLTYDLLFWWEMAQLNVWREDGTSLPGWPVSLPEAYDPPLCAVGDIDGDGDYEIVGSCNYDDLVYAWHAENGQLVEGEWPVPVGDYFYGEIVGTPLLADLDGDGDSEVIVGLASSSSSSRDNLYALQGDGSVLWSRRFSPIGPMSVADFDRDGNVDIAMCGYGPGMSTPYTYILDKNGQQVKRWRGGNPRGTVATDLDGDGQLELIFCTEDSVQAVRINGSTVWTTRINDPLSDSGTMTAGDLDGDGRSEVFVNNYVQSDGFAYTLIYALDAQGRFMTDAGFPKVVIGNPRSSSLLIGDIDGDGGKELLAATAGKPTMAWEADGSTTPGYPMFNLTCEQYCSAALEDLDQDGDIELLMAGYDYRFHVVDLPGQYDAELIDWGSMRHDPQCSGSTAAGPMLEPVVAPEQVTPGQRIEFELHPSSPAGAPVHLLASNLPAGAYFDPETLTVSWKPAADQVFQTFTFSFLVTDGIRQVSRSASIEVLPSAIYYATMDADPGWQLDDGWSWSVPTGEGSWSGDPTAGYTGESVLGYARGDYANNLAQTRYATTGPIDCRGYKNIRLSFWRWLGIESPYDYACVQVSNDGMNWTNLWTTGVSHISDSSWQFVEYVVPAAIGDGQPTIYFRWGIGPTDASVTCPGWNIDDVQVTGDQVGK
jgi:subtilisin family serine protease